MDAFQRNFETALKMDVYNKFPELNKSLLQKRFTINDVGITHRWITHWELKGLLPQSSEKGKWRTFDFVEYIWLKIVVKMREFNVGLEAIKNVKEMLLGDQQDLLKLLLNDPRFIQSFQAAANANGFSYDEKRTSEILQMPMIREKLLEAKIPPRLYFIILDTLLLKGHFPILLNKDGQCIYIKESFIDIFSKVGFVVDFMRKSYLSISLTEILGEFIREKDLSVVSGQLHLLTSKESQVIQIIRSEELKSLKIRFNENHEIDLLEMTKEEKIDKAARLVDLILNNGYQKITITTQGGKPIYCENEIKKRLN